MKTRATTYLVLAVLAVIAVYSEVRPHFHQARLVQLSVLLVLCIGAIRLSRGTRRDWLLTTASFLGGLVVLEASCAILGAPHDVLSDSGMEQVRAIVGFGAAKAGVYRIEKIAPDGRVVYDAHVTINESLIRATRTADGPGAIAFFGDSFTFGTGVNDGDTLPQRFADLRHGAEPILNLSFPGWSPAQNLAALQAGLYRGLLVRPRRFVLMTAAWHAERTACRAPWGVNAPRYEIVGGALELEGPCLGPVARAWHGFLSRFAIYRTLIEPRLRTPNHHDVETYLKIVQTFVETAAHDGVKTTIIFLPYGDAYLKPSGFTEADIVAAFRKTGADVLVDALPRIADPRLYIIRGDQHPTPLANVARAKELDAHLDALTGGKASPGSIGTAN